MRDYVPPAMIVGALALALSGVLDRAGLEGASRGLALGAAICAPLWLMKLWRDARERREEQDRADEDRDPRSRD